MSSGRIVCLLLAVATITMHGKVITDRQYHDHNQQQQGNRLIVAPNAQAAGWGSLFAPENRAELKDALNKVDVFKFSVNCFTNLFPYCGETNWTMAVDSLQDMGVEVAVEVGMFQLGDTQLPNSCNGTASALDDYNKVKNFVEAGGRLTYWTMDGIFQHTYPYTFDSGAQLAKSCNFTISEGVEEGVKYVKMISTLLPKIQFGMNEPVPWYNVGNYSHINMTYPKYQMDRDLPTIIQTFLHALEDEGAPKLEYFHADSPYEYNNGQIGQDYNGYAKLIALQEAVQSYGIRFGKYFNSQDGGLAKNNDELFYLRTIADGKSFQAASGGMLPQDTIVESWFPRPSKLLPVSDKTSFFGVVQQFSMRTAMTRLPPDTMKQSQLSYKTVKIAAVQVNGTTDTGEINLAAVDKYLQQGKEDGAKLIVFPEYYLGSIHASDSDVVFAHVKQSVKQNGIYLAIGSWLLSPDVNASSGCPGVNCSKQYTNSILLFNPRGELSGIYNKTHAAIGACHPGVYWPPCPNELEWHMHWGDSYPIFDLDFARIGIQTCYDGYFPEPSRTMALKGAEFLLWPNGRGGSVEVFLVQQMLFHNTMNVIATNQAYGLGTMMGDATHGGWAPPVELCDRPGDCYISSEFNLTKLREIRGNNRMLHQRRPDLATELGMDWATSEFYNN
eukprot:m.37808 g.37808  ORF g.37808 m.37808 type:complete len:669 (+) comp9354_c0_seq4:68-2074(+)